MQLPEPEGNLFLLLCSIGFYLDSYVGMEFCIMVSVVFSCAFVAFCFEQ